MIIGQRILHRAFTSHRCLSHRSHFLWEIDLNVIPLMCVQIPLQILCIMIYIEIQIVMVIEMVIGIEIVCLCRTKRICEEVCIITIATYLIEPHIQRCRELPDFPRVQMPPVREILTAVHEPRAYFCLFRALRDDIDDAAHGL